ncbi:MAG TPA: hypothetical protein VGA44_09650 [Steroidobacteraceae bacterium]
MSQLLGGDSSVPVLHHRHRAIVVVAFLAGCAAAPERPARSTVGCAKAALERHLPPGLPDKLAHCVAAGVIARDCSPTEAQLAALGKELRDAFGPGDAEWSDWRAARAGVRCAREQADDAAIVECCKATEANR